MSHGVFAAVAFFAPLVLYFTTLAPTVTLEDSGEFIVAARHLGVLHPSGYPLWTLLAHTFTWIPWGNVAERVHLFSAVCGAGTCWLVYLVARRILGSRWAALFGALGLAASEILWSQSVIAEVYTLNSFATMLVLYLAIGWRGTRSPSWLYWMALCIGLGLANHPLIALVAVPVFVWLVCVDWRAVVTPKLAAVGMLLVTLGLSVYLYIPIRAAENPPINVGRADTIEKAIAHVRREAYQSEGEMLRWAGDGGDAVLHTLAAWRGTANTFWWPLSVLAIVGVFAWPRDKRDVLGLTFGIAIFNTLAINIGLGAQYNYWWDFVHRVYYLPTHAMAGLWVAAGASWALRSARQRGRAAELATIFGLALVVIATCVISYPGAHRQGDRRAERYGLDLLGSAPTGAGFLPLQDEVIYPLSYLRWVEGVRPDVKILSEEFGWDPTDAPTAVMVASPITPKMRQAIPDLAPYSTIPRGIAYQVLPTVQAAKWRANAFEPLAQPPEDPEREGWPGNDPFAETLLRRYSVYHTRLGVKLWTQGRQQAARAEFEKAEELDPGDAYAAWTRYRAYKSIGIFAERWNSLLESALADHAAKVDPAIDRYYPVTREEIQAALDALGSTLGPGPSPGPERQSTKGAP